MIKKILLIITLMYAAAAFAAVDVNKATAAELDGVKGIGPGLSTKILEERSHGDFKDWSDFIARVGGVGEKTAARLSTEGLTVNGKKFNAAAVAKAKAKAKADKADKKARNAQTSDKNGTASAGGQQGPSTASAPAAQPSATAAPTANAADGATKK